MVDLHEAGIILTLYLISINALLIAANALPDVDILSADEDSLLNTFLVNESDLNQVNPQTTEFAGIRLFSVGLVGAPLAFLNAGVSATLVVAKFLFLLVAGYSFIIEKVTVPLGLGNLGFAISAIFFFIELVMLFTLLLRAISVVRGGGSA